MKALVAGVIVAAGLLLVFLFILDGRVQELTRENERLQTNVTNLTASRANQESRAERCEERRDIEQTRCVDILDDMETRCEIRVEEASNASCQIRETAYACPSFDQNMCPNRDLIAASELRRAAGARGSE